MAKPTKLAKNLPNCPAKGCDFTLRTKDKDGKDRYARVIYTVKSNDGQTMMVEHQAFEVDAKGNFVAGPDGKPSRTPSHMTEVHLSGTLGDKPTVSLKAGWVFYPDPKPVPSQDALPPGYTQGSGNPVDPPADPDATPYYFDIISLQAWRWHPGAIEGPIADRAVELDTIVASSDVLTDFTL